MTEKIRHEAEPHPGGIMSNGVDAEWGESIAALRNDRDRWQTRAKQAEGRATSLAKDVLAVSAERDESQKQLTAAQIQLREATQQVALAQEAVVRQRQGWDDLQQQLSNRVRQVNDLQAQLEAAVHAPDLSADLERVAAERDAAREEVRGLQVRAEQAEGDARNAAAKLGNLNGEVVRLKAQVTTKTDTLLRAEAANDALQVVILNIIRELRNDD